VVPEELRTGEVRYLYRDRPLFSYLYFTAPIPGGGTAMAAALMKANLPRNLEENPGDFVTDFRDTVGEDLRISAPRGHRERTFSTCVGRMRPSSALLSSGPPRSSASGMFDPHGRGSWV
ncbi:MAG: hypothetical protein V3T24_04100, partial [Longimicrobiales bacterium]